MYILVLMTSSILAFLLASLNGAFSIGSTVGVASSARAISQKLMLFYSLVSFLSGGVLAGVYTAKTFALRVVSLEMAESELAVSILVLSSLGSTILWSIVMLKTRIPVSITQLAIGGLIGSGLIVYGFASIQWNMVLVIFLSWGLTGVLAMILSITITKFNQLLREHWGDSASIAEYLLIYIALASIIFLIANRFLPYLHAMYLSIVIAIVILLLIKIIVSKASTSQDRDIIARQLHLLIVTMILAMYFGAHDMGSSAGLLSTILVKVLGLDTESSITISLVLVSMGFVIGAYIWGSRIVETVAGRITPLTLDTSIIVQLSVIYTVFILVANGIPSSITIALIGGIAGVGYARGLQYVDTRLILRISTLWIIGVALSIALSFSLSLVLLSLSG